MRTYNDARRRLGPTWGVRRSPRAATVERLWPWTFRTAFALLLLIGAACQEPSSPSPPGPHMIVRFGYFGDSNGSFDFVARASRPGLLDSVRAELALPVDQRGFLNGPVRAAAEGENLEWRWAFEYDAWHLTDFSAEVCDATPQYLEDHLAEWLSSVGEYCPWSAFVKDTAWVR
jgi:hypothetical protein